MRFFLSVDPCRPRVLKDPGSLPHAGYHWDGWTQPFFEGWYTRVTLPIARDPTEPANPGSVSFSFMYAINPQQGGMAQVLGPQDQLCWRTFSNPNGFWAERDHLGHRGALREGRCDHNPAGLQDPLTFFQILSSGYQFSAHLNQGILPDPLCSEPIRWLYRIQPHFAYGIPPQATMGIWSYLPIFEPGWQILMAHGLASGWVEWGGQRYEFQQVPAYAEKNWGQSFPRRWFWIQCNAFPEHPGLSLTCAGAERRVLARSEEVALISLHGWGSQPFLEWRPGQAHLTWQVDPWGSWQITGQNAAHCIQLQGHSRQPGQTVFTPGPKGMRRNCRDTLAGHLLMQLWRRNGQVWTQILTAESHQAGLEVGGEHVQTWQGQC
ncbi:tocopherol cyclase family protein [Synechococcus sp. Nb3U1]|uniref:tocopherol cyclase family protein n=1 Tax=Synechococcus sp. Nb3U1 TaxID=1914529 RepID=UPI001F2C6480|nr:tocopherol cyclase family protein [Synechococcus sp. Nb3U1]